MNTVSIDDLGGTLAVARMAGVAAPSVTAWRRRGIPMERCPALEAGTEGRYTCEQMRPDVRWVRVADAAWPWHPKGRPLIDVAANSIDQRLTEQGAAGQQSPAAGTSSGEETAAEPVVSTGPQLHEQAQPRAA